MAFPKLSLRNSTFVSIAEVILLVIILPGHLPSHNPVAKIAALAMSLNYFILISYWAFIFPIFISNVKSQPHIKFALFRSYFRRYMGNIIVGETFLQWSTATPNNGIIVFPRLIAPSRLLLTEPASLADVLAAHVYDYTKPPRFSVVMKEVIGKGLILVEGDQHLFMRKQTLPAFTKRRIRDLYPMMWSKSKSFSETLRTHLRTASDDESVLEITRWANKITLDVMGIAGLERDFGATRGGEDQLVEDYYTITNPSREMAFYFQLATIVSLGLVQLLPWKMHTTFVETTESIRRNGLRLVQQKRDAIAKDPEGHHDILSHIIQTNSFSDSELNEQALTFLLAGHETTSLTLTWACYVLAKHQDMQEKLRQEVGQLFDLYETSELQGADIAAGLEQLPYLSAIINETIRFFPAVPVTARVAIRDTSVMGYDVPKGTEVIMSPWMINRSEKLWGPDASIFRPERWIDEDGKANKHGGADSNYSQLTFLHGPHNCIGQDFVKAELRCLLAAMIRSFRWMLSMEEKDIVSGGVITIKPKNGLYLKIEEIIST